MPRKSVLLIEISDVDSVTRCHDQPITLSLRSRIDFFRKQTRVFFSLRRRQCHRFSVVDRNLKLQFVTSDALVSVVVGNLHHQPIARINSLKTLSHFRHRTVAVPHKVVRDRSNRSVEVSCLKLPGD